MLIDLLEKQLALHKSLLELAYMKTAAVKKNNMDELNKIAREEQKHITAITILEKKRMNDSDKTVSERMMDLPAVDQEKIETLRQELFKLLNELKNVNELNGELIHQSFQVVQLQMDLLAPPEAGTYSPGEEEDGSVSGPIFDSKA